VWPEGTLLVSSEDEPKMRSSQTCFFHRNIILFAEGLSEEEASAAQEG
jgi:hypothetical protein